METNERYITILRGVPGSGKSTHARELVNNGWDRINKDELRLMLNNYKLNNDDEKIVHNIQGFILLTLMAEGRNIVIDNTHTKQKYLDEIRKTVDIYNCESSVKPLHTNEYHYTIVVKTMDTPLDECIRRNSLRERPVPEEVIRSMYKSLFPERK